MYSTLSKCLFCRSKDLIPYLNLGNQPLANSFTKFSNELLPAFPLELNLCSNCGHSQLGCVVEPKLMFSNYLYVSGTTKTLENHFKSFAQDCTDRFGVASALEIGCNDGSCLKQLKEKGWKVLGVDPAENLQRFSKENGVTVIPKFWKRGISDSLPDLDYNLIYGMNVFAHNLNPSEFLNECIAVLAPGGTIVIEAPYAYNMFKINDFGQIYHEHISYLTCAAMQTLCDTFALGVVDVVETDVHGGSIRFYMQQFSSHSKKFLNMVKNEKEVGMRDIAFYEQFSKNVTKNVFLLKNALDVQKSFGCRVVGYGAAAKASTVINAIGSNLLSLDYIVDDNPLKVDRYMPGTDVQILPTSALEMEEGPMAIWITAHNFQKEIIERIKSRRQGRKGDVIISYVPKIQIEDL